MNEFFFSTHTSSVLLLLFFFQEPIKKSRAHEIESIEGVVEISSKKKLKKTNERLERIKKN